MEMLDIGKRKREFILYHKHGDGDCNGQVLKQIAIQFNLNTKDIFDLSYFYSITYCVASSLYMLKNRDAIYRNADTFAEENKKELIFQADRKYVKYVDRFNRLLKQFTEMPPVSVFIAQTSGNGKTMNGNVACKYIENWWFFNRFSAYLFLETFCDISGIEMVETEKADYGKDRMLYASGLFRVFGLDDYAIETRETRKLPIRKNEFEKMILELQEDIKKANGDDNFLKVETSLCAYEKFFRGTRYNGYYADRQLEETMQLLNNRKFEDVCCAVLEARNKAIEKQFRGEDGGWFGIRQELKKYYLQNGKINWNQ